MFSLRSSPSTLVCDLREGWASTSTTAAVHLSAPRPHRPSVMFGFDVSYDGVSAGSGVGADGVGLGGSGGSSTRGAFSPAVSDYAGVFEAGFDPAQVRASMTKKVVEVETASTARDSRMAQPRGLGGACGGIGGRGWPDLDGEACAVERGPLADGEDDYDDGDEEEGDGQGYDAIGRNDQDEEETDFLFEMEGLKELPPATREEVRENDCRGSGGGGACAGGAASGWRQGGGGGGDDDEGSGRNGGWGMAATAAAAATAAGVVAATAAAAGGRQRSNGGLPHLEAEQGSTAISSTARAAGGVRDGTSGACGVGGGLNSKGTAVLRTPRVIAPRGTRCVGGGMYRLRLSTSC